MPDTFWRFIDDSASFIAENPDKISRLYFPLTNESGIISSITPNLHGDIKTGQHSFLTIPVSTEDLANTLYNRNFWIHIDGYPVWSMAFGYSDETLVEAGLLWHKVIKLNKKLGIKLEAINFAPSQNEPVELMSIEITNISKKNLKITPTLATPIYARSADNLRDHRHVTSLLNRIRLNKYGVTVTPTMSFDERGHKINKLSYFVFGCDGNSNPPKGSFPTIMEFTGEGGSLERPKAILKNILPAGKSGINRQGKEAIGAIRFKALSLGPARSMRYIAVMGVAEDNPERIFRKFNSAEKIDKALAFNKNFWLQKSEKVYFSTHDKNFDRWMKWVGLQPVLRKIFGCSFLPDFDYGRGGRGWRDLWQDSLALLLIHPEECRSTLINNFGGVRLDGSNATIIGKNQGEFISDRNNISRVWMDHGVWPFITLNLYINQSGDKNILFEKAPFLESNKIDTILEHILLQHKRLFTKVGNHGNFLLEGADWNDGLDMAKDKGESVAFTAAYAGNLLDIAILLERLINFPSSFPLPKGERGRVRGIIQDLRKKAMGLTAHIRKNEWIKVKSGHSFFNGYYDNKGRRVEGDNKKGVRMILTGQVFPIMSGIATEDQIREIYKSAKKYLWDSKLKGFRLNTDFKEIQSNLGRAFGFAYGEKENGSFFSHMNVMFGYALYKRGFVKEGFEVINSIYNMCLSPKARIYPCIPEYFNSDGRGMYTYLTGSASWLIFTMLTQVFGVRGDMGDLVIDPKLTKSQFGKSQKASVTTTFAGKKIQVNYFNPDNLDYGEYKIGNISINGNSITGIPIKRELFLKLASRPTNSIDINIVRARPEGPSREL